MLLTGRRKIRFRLPISSVDSRRASSEGGTSAAAPSTTNTTPSAYFSASACTPATRTIQTPSAPTTATTSPQPAWRIRPVWANASAQACRTLTDGASVSPLELLQVGEPGKLSNEEVDRPSDSGRD